MVADHLIVGGGSAGCVLAARLSEDSDRRVVLIEAGRNLSPSAMPADIASRYPGRAYLDTRNIWRRLMALYGRSPAATRRHTLRLYEQARLLGGGSAINAMMANRGAPSDYAEWVALGADGWDWAACLPWFKDIETDRDYSGCNHGQCGPVVIRRISEDRLSPFVARVMETIERRGFQRFDDQNGEWQDGVCKGAVAISDAGTRQPTSQIWLTAEVRQRPNLILYTDHEVRRILFDGQRATGVEIASADDMFQIAAGEVIVSSGAIHSPALLLRSGIGPAGALADTGIEPVHDLPGVGRNLMEHPSIAVGCVLPPAMRETNAGEHHEQGVWRFSSGLAGTPTGDMHCAILARSGWHSVGRRIGSLFFWVNKSYSRGHVRLTPGDVYGEPDVDFRLAGDPRDLARLAMAFRRGVSVLADAHMTNHRERIFPASYSPRVAAVARSTLGNALARGVLSTMLDYSGPLQPVLVDTSICRGKRVEDLIDDQSALEAFIRRNVGGTWHASGTCRMGAAGDAAAVVSADGRVHGVYGLRVCDASIMPSIPRANTNLPTLMIAERIANAVRRGQLS